MIDHGSTTPHGNELTEGERVLLSDLLDEPRLGLTLLTGRERLDRAIRGIYITDLIDPRRYLHGGELVLSGLVWHTGPADSHRFAAALADARVSGLVAGTARLGKAPPDLVEACTRQGVPLFEISISVSFNTLFEHVVGAIRHDSAPRRELVAAVAEGADLERVVRLATNALDVDCWVCSAVGTVVAGSAELPAKLLRSIAREFLAAEKLPRTVRPPEGGRYVLWPVGAGTESRIARWFLVVAGEDNGWEPERESTVTELATAVALLRTRRDEAEHAAARPVESPLRGLLGGTVESSEVASRLREAGLPVDGPLRVVSLATEDQPRSATDLLREMAASTRLVHVVAGADHEALAVFAEQEGMRVDLSGLAEWLREILEDLQRGLPRLRLTIGLGDIGDAASLRGAVEEAHHTRVLAGHRSPGCGLATASDLATHQVLISSVPDGLRSSYRQRLLSGLVDYDRTHHSDLVRTLRVFLECSGSWSRCSQRLHVHVNTLRYRIRRIEEITGRDLGDFPTRVDFYLALQLES